MKENRYYRVPEIRPTSNEFNFYVREPAVEFNDAYNSFFSKASGEFIQKINHQFPPKNLYASSHQQESFFSYSMHCQQKQCFFEKAQPYINPTRIFARHTYSYPGLVGFPGEKVNDALHDPARGRLARVHPRRDDDALLAARLVVDRRRGYRQVVDAVAGEATAEQPELREARLHRIVGDFAEVLLMWH